LRKFVLLFSLRGDRQIPVYGAAGRDLSIPGERYPGRYLGNLALRLYLPLFSNPSFSDIIRPKLIYISENHWFVVTTFFFETPPPSLKLGPARRTRTNTQYAIRLRPAATLSGEGHHANHLSSEEVNNMAAKDGIPQFMDYAMPRAHRLPSFETHRTETPSPLNPLGVKGIGEAATIGSTPAVTNAVVDALSHLGVTHLDMPLTSQKIWGAIRAAA
jgi:hypothetical protein